MWKILPRTESMSWALVADRSGWRYDEPSPTPTKTVWSGATSTVPIVCESSPVPGTSAEYEGRLSRMGVSFVRLDGADAELAVVFESRP